MRSGGLSYSVSFLAGVPWRHVRAQVSLEYSGRAHPPDRGYDGLSHLGRVANPRRDTALLIAKSRQT